MLVGQIPADVFLNSLPGGCFNFYLFRQLQILCRSTRYQRIYGGKLCLYGNQHIIIDCQPAAQGIEGVNVQSAGFYYHLDGMLAVFQAGEAISLAACRGSKRSGVFCCFNAVYKDV